MQQNSRALRIVGLYKSFGTREVLRGVSMNVEPGQVMGFVGANGSGKTTTMRIVMGIIDANRGRVTFGANLLTPRSGPPSAICQKNAACIQR